MYRPRVIVTLLLEGKRLVKTCRFQDGRYIGDPLNAVKIFNDLVADELVFLDIGIRDTSDDINIDLIKSIAEEAYMPFAYGGGISSITQVEDILSAGAEKVVLNTAAYESPELVDQVVSRFGGQALVVGLDIKNNKVYSRSGKTAVDGDPVQIARLMESRGVGELLITSIEREGTLEGYDLDLVKRISSNVGIPVICNGGAIDYDCFQGAVEAGACAVSAGSTFVFSGPKRAILMNYPDREDFEEIFEYSDK